jgi:IS30 family transposase
MADHLTLVERQFLYRLKTEGRSKAEIAELLGRHRSTVCRELKRNTGQRGYRPKQAQRLAAKRRQACRRPRKMEDAKLHQYVQERLEKRWSPDQIAGRSRHDFVRQTIFSGTGTYALPPGSFPTGQFPTTVQIVPEPSTLALLCVGLLGPLASARRRR